MTRREEIENASEKYSRKIYVGSVDKNLAYQDFCSGAEWADNNPQDEFQLIIDLIHQRSVAFDYSKEQSEKLAIAIEALEQCKIYSECYEELMLTIDNTLEYLKD